MADPGLPRVSGAAFWQASQLQSQINVAQQGVNDLLMQGAFQRDIDEANAEVARAQALVDQHCKAASELPKPEGKDLGFDKAASRHHY